MSTGTVLSGAISSFSTLFKNFHRGLSSQQKAQNLQNLEVLKIAIANSTTQTQKDALTTELTNLLAEMAAEGQ